MTDDRTTASRLYSDASRAASEIESLRGLHKDVKASPAKQPITGSVIHYRNHGIKVWMPKAVALRLLSAEIARKEAELAEIKKALK